MQLCCIPLRDLRYLRENTRKSTQSICTKKPQCLPQISLITQTKPKTTTTSQTVFLCEIMQLAAFLCVICVICGRIHARGLKQSAQMKPQCLPQISLIYADKPQNHTNLTNFLCDMMQLAAFLCVICVICGRIFTQEYSINRQRRKPMCLPQISQMTQTNPKTTITKLSFSAI